MKRFSFAGAGIWMLAVVLVAGIVHLSSVFLLPAVATRSSFVRLAGVPPGQGFQPLPRPTPGDTSLPFTDPGVLLAACRYDLAGGAYRVRVDIDSGALMSLSFHSRVGIVFSTLTDRAALGGKLDVLLGTAAQIDAVEAADTDDFPTREVRLVSPSPVGMIFVRAMAPSTTGEGALARRLAAAECGFAG